MGDGGDRGGGESSPSEVGEDGLIGGRGASLGSGDLAFGREFDHEARRGDAGEGRAGTLAGTYRGRWAGTTPGIGSWTGGGTGRRASTSIPGSSGM